MLHYRRQSYFNHQQQSVRNSESSTSSSDASNTSNTSNTTRKSIPTNFRDRVFKHTLTDPPSLNKIAALNSSTETNTETQTPALVDLRSELVQKLDRVNFKVPSYTSQNLMFDEKIKKWLYVDNNAKTTTTTN